MPKTLEAFPRTSLGPRDGRPPPRWAVRTAHLITLLVLPSGLWRVGLALGFSMGLRAGTGSVHGWVTVYVLGLSLVSEGVALLSMGLVRPWGEVVPWWVPLAGGRRLPPLAVTLTAATGAVALIAIWAYATVNFLLRTASGAPGQGFAFTDGRWEALLIACYLPLLLWGPLLLVLTRAYHRRRRPGRSPA